MSKLSFFTFILLFVYNFSFSQDEGICKDINHLTQIEAHLHQTKNANRVNEATGNYDIGYHKLEWTVDPAVRYISGKVTSIFQTLEDNFEAINFDFSDELEILSIQNHGQELTYELSSDDNLKIFLPQPLSYGVIDSITINYQGVPTSTGFGAFETNTHNGTPVMWTLSEPYGAKEWWPSKQDLTDKIDSIDVIVTTPKQYRVASNGILINETLNGEHKSFHWKHRFAIPAYLVAIAITDYSVYSDYVPYGNGDSIEVLNYVYPENIETAKTQTQNIVQIMSLYNELFGVYPFAEEKYGHAQFGWGGGMEHQTMSFMGGFSYDLQAHELAHQWFGDKVTCGSWQDIWLNEGFATYLTGLTKEFIANEDVFLSWKRGRINNITSQSGGSVWVDDTTSVSRIFNGRLSYNKGAMLLHMLRWKIGDENFFQGVNNYLNDPEIAFSYAQTQDFKQHLENQSGIDLTEFFNDWYYGEGYPSYHIDWYPTDNGSVITVNQTTSPESVDFYEMPLPIYFGGEDHDTIVTVDHLFSGQTFEIDLPFNIDSISIDPELWLISANNTVEEISVNTDEFPFSDAELTVYPNPFSNVLNIHISNQNQDPLIIKVVDISGKVRLIRNEDMSQFTLDLSTVEPGIYSLSIQTKDHFITRKVIKM